MGSEKQAQNPNESKGCDTVDCGNCLSCSTKELRTELQDILIKYGKDGKAGLVEITYALNWLALEGIRQIAVMISQPPPIAIILSEGQLGDENEDNRGDEENKTTH